MQPTHIIWRFLYNTVAWIGGGLLVCYLVWQITTLSDLGPTYTLPILPLYVAIIWLSIIVHELGHALAALLTGFHLEAIVCGPLQVEKQNKQWRWGINWRSDTPGFVRATLQQPNGFRWRYSIFVLAGPFFTLLLLLFSLWLFLSYIDQIAPFNINQGLRHLHSRSLLPFYTAGFCCLYNLLVLLLCSIPMLVPPGYLNDAGIILWVWKAGKRDIILSDLYAQMQAGTRPRDIDRIKLLDCLGSPGTGTSQDCYSYLLGYYCFLDAGAFTVAELLLEKAVECYALNPDSATPSVLLEQIYFHALYGEPVENTASIFQACEGHASVQQSTLLRAQAACHYVAQDYPQALATAEAALKLLANAEDKGGSIAERDWLGEIVIRSRRKD